MKEQQGSSAQTPTRPRGQGCCDGQRSKESGLGSQGWGAAAEDITYRNATVVDWAACSG